MRDGQKKRKQSESATDEPDSKMGRTDTDPEDERDEASAAGSEGAEGKVTVLSVQEELALLKKQLQEKQKAENDGADPSEDSQEPGTSNAEGEGQSGALSIEEELAQLKAKLGVKPTSPNKNEPKKVRGFFERSGVKITAKRISFACSVCKFRSFYSEDLTAHMESKFHKDIFRFLTNRLSKGNGEFLQEYLNVKQKNMEKTLTQINNHEAVICQLYKERDLTRDIGMEHFIKKVEAAHCAVCDMYIPMQHSLVQRHLKSPDHHFNRKYMMEECKKTALTVARSILNHKPVRDKLEKYLKGENPFVDGADDHDLDDSMLVEAAEADQAEDKQEEAEAEGEGEAEGGGEASEKQEEHEELEEEEKPEAEGISEEGKGDEELEGDEYLEGDEDEQEGEEDAEEVDLEMNE